MPQIYPMPRSPMGPYYGAWCQRLASILMQRKLSQERAARLLGMNQSTLCGYLRGRNKPPMDRLPRWADLLRLRGSERDQFIWLAYEYHTPVPVWERLILLESELEHARASALALRGVRLGEVDGSNAQLV